MYFELVLKTYFEIGSMFNTETAGSLFKFPVIQLVWGFSTWNPWDPNVTPKKCCSEPSQAFVRVIRADDEAFFLTETMAEMVWGVLVRISEIVSPPYKKNDWLR